MKNQMMKKRIAALAAAALMSAACTVGSVSGGYIPALSRTVSASAAESLVKFISSTGYGEGICAMWSAVSGASGYNVYVDGTQIDTMLVRQYSGYMRADAVGLKAGSHTMKVVPVINGKEDSSKAAETKATAYAHDRSGFAFVSGDANGAYNSDGTLKANAVVVYVTDENKDSVTASIDSTGKGASELKGIQNIILGYKKGKESRPLNIRFIGNITDPAVLNNGDLYLDAVTAGCTVEGIGNDATLNGFGLVMKNCSNVEVRNLGFMNCNSNEGDNCGLQQNNNHVWVHNCDFFYGDAGTDKDQVKGDGALDTKTSTYITHSYNHFWDNGKCNLQGMKSEKTDNYITYHHNWYDHSDSRHPRIRTCSVHCYNNYFDGNAKYGIGVTMGASCFAENNFFRNCKYPMLSSEQGSDVATGGTFSGETGGVIKAYGNVMSGQKAFVSYSDDKTDFDAYVASSKTEKVSGDVKTKNGGTAYNNFDTSSVMYSYTPDKAEDVPAIVAAKAGRVEGGDFKWTFNNAVDDASYEVNTDLKNKLTNYKGTVIAIGSGFKDDNSPAPVVTTAAATTAAATTAAPAQTTAAATTQPSSGTTEGTQVHNFTTNGTSSSFYTITGNLSTSKGSVNYNGMNLTQCLKIESATSVSFKAGSSGDLVLVFGAAGATIKLDGTKLTADASGIIKTNVGAGAHTLTKADTANLFYMSFGGSAAAPVQTTAPQTTAAQNTTAPAQTTASQGSNVDVNGVKVVTAGGWNEMLYLVLSGIKKSDVTGVSYSGASKGTFNADDLAYLVRDTEKGLRVDIPGVKAGTYAITLTTSKGNLTKSGIKVEAQDRSGYAHFNYTEGVGAYTDSGELKANAKVIYVTNDNKDTVTITSKDGTTVKGIGNILNSAGQDVGGGKTSNDGTKPNTNSGIIKKLAQDGTPLVVRIIGNVKAPEGLTAYDSTDFGGSVGDNGFMARMKSGMNITIEGIGTDAVVDGWGFHFIAEGANAEYGKSFEVRNIAFRNVPEDCVGMEGVQEGTKLTAPVERCWVHNCEFYKPTIANPAESDKSGGDGACDFKRGLYFTNSYCYYEGYHKTNLVGASDSNLQFHLTYHHNYWNKCESRGPLARQANIHMYNNIFSGQTSYCMNPRANAYIFSEYNLFESCKNPMQVKLGAIKSFNDVLNNCKGDMNGTVVSSKSEKVNSDNQYANFDTDASLCYVPSGSYLLHTDTSKLASYFETYGGCMDETAINAGGLDVTPAETTAPAQTTSAATTAKPAETTAASSVQAETTAKPAETTAAATSAATTTTAASTAAQTSQTAQKGKLGDVNGDGNVTVADSVAILQYLGNKDKYPLSDAAKANADVYNKGDGVTARDALSIQKLDAGILTSLPESAK